MKLKGHTDNVRALLLSRDGSSVSPSECMCANCMHLFACMYGYIYMPYVGLRNVFVSFCYSVADLFAGGNFGEFCVSEESFICKNIL